MGAKASTPATNNGHQSPRSRTFSTSSSTDVVSSGSGFNLLRALPGMHVQQTDRQRARSLSSVPDLQSAANGNNNNNNGHLHSDGMHQTIHQQHQTSATAGIYGEHGAHHHQMMITGTDLSDLVDDSGQAGSSSSAAAAAAAAAGALGALGRVYTATSLPSHIWSLNGIKCPVCSKYALPDDIECHLVMCLTKPRLSYNEDILTEPREECVICLEELNPGDVIARLPCLCIYHKSCIDQWFEVNRSCPEHPGD